MKRLDGLVCGLSSHLNNGEDLKDAFELFISFQLLNRDLIVN